MSENDNKNIEKLDDNLDLTTENEEDNSENNPDIDPELTKIDQSLLDENGDLKPEKMTCKNKTIVWWKCSICGNEWQSSIALRTQGFGRCKKCDYHVIKK